MKVLVHILVALLFVVFAAVQLNDPDPIHWVLIYLGVSFVAILYVAKRYYPAIPLLGFLACLVGLLLLSPDFITWLGEGMPTITGSMKAESPHVELVREFLGFLIAGIAYIAYFMGYRTAIKLRD